ncbi:hypothetical protein L873DRAFT_1896215 [Choiromyces venosus 120613-1]|uniref:Uncharacterized protein n=1 Tax=Choiromyces venosus 120613-1 TaxID=1336337 RepID=A0A3N4JUY2_9PEZI|nr:hypothetical protein L873DRAFT_1896215 [Choiromyces venosus 120613-1]
MGGMAWYGRDKRLKPVALETFTVLLWGRLGNFFCYWGFIGHTLGCFPGFSPYLNKSTDLTKKKLYKSR